MAARSGFSGFVRNMGLQTDAAGVLATAARWFLRLIVLVVAFDALSEPEDFAHAERVAQQLLDVGIRVLLLGIVPGGRRDERGIIEPTKRARERTTGGESAALGNPDRRRRKREAPARRPASASPSRSDACRSSASPSMPRWRTRTPRSRRNSG